MLQIIMTKREMHQKTSDNDSIPRTYRIASKSKMNLSSSAVKWYRSITLGVDVLCCPAMICCVYSHILFLSRFRNQFFKKCTLLSLSETLTTEKIMCQQLDVQTRRPALLALMRRRGFAHTANPVLHWTLVMLTILAIFSAASACLIGLSNSTVYDGQIVFKCFTHQSNSPFSRC